MTAVVSGGPHHSPSAAAQWGSGLPPFPVERLDIELSEPLPYVPPVYPGRDGAASILLRMHRAPVGTMLVRVPGGGIPPAELAAAVWDHAGPAVADHLRGDGLAVPSALDACGYASSDEPACHRYRRAVLERAPSVTVVIATRSRPEQLRRCLASVWDLRYPTFDVVVVDNAPVDGATEQLVREEAETRPVRYVREDRRGLAAAHNAGVAVSTGAVLAFTDDDVEVDPDWLTALAGGFSATEGVGAVTGLICPAELRTRAQFLLEQHAGFAKGFTRTVFDLEQNRPPDPLYPFTAGQLGSGANMAFDAGLLRRMGGFDPAMGTGTASYGGDDLVALFSVVAARARLVYQPDAVVFHHHRADMTALRRQSFGYGVGLGAYLTNVTLHHPVMALSRAHRVPAALAATLNTGSDRNRRRYEGWPPDLVREERRGILAGPGAYVRSRWQARGAARPGGVA